MSESSFYPTTGRAALGYVAYEMAHAMISPYRTLAGSFDRLLNHPTSPFARLPASAAVHASWRLIDELTKRYGKPAFGIETVRVNGVDVKVKERVVARRPFCRLIHFAKARPLAGQPKVLLIAPMSGHFATLLRGTVRAMLPEHDTFITDWADARTVPLARGHFDLHDYIDYLQDFFRLLGPDLNVIAVCQPSVAALAATALQNAAGDPARPRTLTLMGGPVDAARSPTAVNDYAASRPLSWFKRNVITFVPFPHVGALRAVYPGFAQLAGFMGMNLDSHLQAFHAYFDKLIAGDCDSVSSHRRFYDEYLSVMDLTAEYFLQTLDLVFHRRALATGSFVHRGRQVDCAAITGTTLMTVEGERDDICGLGQTEAAHELCSSLDDRHRYHYVQPGVGHYGVFNGTRWRTEIQPRIREMIRTHAA